MSAQPGVKVRYNPVRTTPAYQLSWVGAQGTAGRRGWWPDLVTAPDDACGNLQGGVVWGGRFVAVGSFANVGAVARAGFAMWDLQTGQIVTDWTLSFTGGTPTVVETDGTFLYLGGSTTAVTVTPNGGTPVTTSGLTGLFRIDYNGNVDTTWTPTLNATPGLTAMRYNAVNGTLYVAGNGLTTVNGTGRTRIAELTLTAGVQGAATAWNPGPDGQVNAIVIDPVQQKVYLGGAYTHLYGLAQTRLARVTMVIGAAGAADTWAPAPDGTVNCLAWDPLTRYLYVGGSFGNIGGVVRNRAAIVDDTATTDPYFNPNLNGDCDSIALYFGLALLAGAFTTVGGTGRNRLAAFGPDNSLRNWNPNANGTVDQLVLLDRSVWALGAYTTIGTSANTYASVVSYPLFVDADTKFVSKSGSDGNAGTRAFPYLTVGMAVSQLGATYVHVVILDSGVYAESFCLYTPGGGVGGSGMGGSTAYAIGTLKEEAGIFASDGQAPTITRTRGAQAGTFGARVSGRTKFSAGAAGTFLYVSKVGNDGTGARGNPALPFATINGALVAAGRLAGDTIQVNDSGRYVEPSISAGANEVTIQAAAGQVPTVAFAQSGSSPMFGMNAGVNVHIYGLVFDLSGVAVYPGPDFISATGNLDLYDCTIINPKKAVVCHGAKAFTIANCKIVGTRNSAIYVDIANSTTVVTNTYFSGCGVISGAAGLKGAIDFEPGAAATTNLTVTFCTVENCPQGAGMYLKSANTDNGVIIITDNVIQDTLNTVRNWKGIDNACAGSSSLTLLNNLIQGMGSNGILEEPASTAGAASYGSCVVKNCGSVDTGVGQHNIACSGGRAFSFLSCASLGAKGAGFYCSMATPAGTWDRCVAMNPGTSGFVDATNAGSITVTACLEQGAASSGLDATPGGAVLTDFCVFQHGQVGGGISAVHAATLTANPQLLNVVPGFENCGLSALSPAVNYNSALADPFFAGSGAGYVNTSCGLNNFLLNLAQMNASFWLDGITFAGDANFYDGVIIRRNANTYPTVASQVRPHVSYCTFSGLGTEGLHATSDAVVERCLFSTFGIGVDVAEAGITVRGCAGQQCAGAFLVLAGSTPTIVGNTAFGCEYGQIDLVQEVPLSYVGNVYASNTTLDYYGAGTQLQSCIPNLSGVIAGGPIASLTGSRLDPLFRVSHPADLRLQAVTAGYLFDSPAKGLVSGQDAGAFVFFYPAVITTWTVVDMGATVGGQRYRNPDHVERIVTPLKLAEGETHGGVTFSVAAAFKTEHAFRWEPVNDMGSNQLADLQAVYMTGDGETQISFDGGTTWIPTRVVRSKTFEFKELEGLAYSDSGIPTPLSTIVFRESS